MMDPLDLHAFADGELDKDLAAQVKSALSSDPAAKAEFDAVLNLKDILRTRSVKYTSDECWKACVVRMNEIDKTHRVESFVRRYAWSMCTILFVLILGGRYMVKDMHGDTAQTADLGRIFSSVKGTSNVPAASPAQQQIYDNVLRRARVAIGAPVNQADGQVQDIPVHRIILRAGDGNVMLFVAPAVVNFEGSAEIPTEPGVSSAVITSPRGVYENCVIWHSDDSTFVLAGEQSVGDLDTLRERITVR
jgi:hypothetical protein